MASEDYRKRYELAKAAMTAILSNPNPDVMQLFKVGYEFNAATISMGAYDIADAMLKIEHEERKNQ